MRTPGLTWRGDISKLPLLSWGVIVPALFNVRDCMLFMI